MNIRKAVVSGSFYPNDKNELLSLINSFSKSEIKSIVKSEFRHINAIITPHAGFTYSGRLSNLSYFLASKQNPKRVIVIGPSHNALFEGSHICLDEMYETPLGNIEVDLEFSKTLKSKYTFINSNEECAFEHSTETQAPFIKHYFSNAKIVEIIYAKQDFNILSELIDELIKDENKFAEIKTKLPMGAWMKKTFAFESGSDKTDMKLEVDWDLGILGSFFPVLQSTHPPLPPGAPLRPNQVHKVSFSLRSASRISSFISCLSISFLFYT